MLSKINIILILLFLQSLNIKSDSSNVEDEGYFFLDYFKKVNNDNNTDD